MASLANLIENPRKVIRESGDSRDLRDGSRDTGRVRFSREMNQSHDKVTEILHLQ